MPRRSLGVTRPLDHHRHAGGLEPAAQHLRLELGPLAELHQAAVVTVVVVVVDASVRARVTSATRQSAHFVAFRRGTRRRRKGTTRSSVRATGAECTRGALGTMSGCPPDVHRQRAFYVETLGCPKNAVDSDKVVASLLADGLAPAAERRGRRPRRRQHVRVHRGRPPGVDRRRARARRRASPARGSW